MVTTGVCAPVMPLARVWVLAFDTDAAAPASAGLPCANVCSGDDWWSDVALFPDPAGDAPLSLLELL